MQGFANVDGGVQGIVPRDVPLRWTGPRAAAIRYCVPGRVHDWLIGLGKVRCVLFRREGDFSYRQLLSSRASCGGDA